MSARLRDLLQDLRVAARSMRRAPMFVLLVAGTLGVGIGVNTTMFSVVDAVLLSPLPYPDPDRLYQVNLRFPGNTSSYGISTGEYNAIREAAPGIETLAYYRYGGGTLTGDGGRPEEPTSLSVGIEFQQALGLEPLVGRRFTAEDVAPGANRVILIGEELWRRRYNADPEIVGRQVQLDETSHEIVGVVPDRFRFPGEGEPIQIFRTYYIDPASTRYGWGGLGVVARIGEDTREAVVEQQLAAVAAALQQTSPDTNTDREFFLRSLHDTSVSGVRTSLLLLWGAVGFVLLLACMNAANLLLSRAATKGHEISVCAALGASRRRIMQRVLSESVLLALLGAVVGLLLAQWSVESVARFGLDNLPRSAEIAVDGRVFFFTVCLALAVGVLYGLLPAWQVSRVDLAAMMKEGSGRSSVGPAGQKVRAALTIGEIAIACILLIGAGLMIRSSMKVRATDPGFSWDNTLTMTMWADMPADEEGVGWTERFYDELLEEVRAVPGVTTATLVSGPPWDGMFNEAVPMVVENHPEFEDGEPVSTARRVVSEGYLEALAIPLQAGRLLESADDADAAPVAVVSRELADRWWPGEDALGKVILLGENRSAREIVGIVGGVRERRLDEEPQPMIYVPFRQSLRVPMTLTLRTESEPRLVQRSVQDAVWRVAPTQGIWRTTTLESMLAGTVARERLYRNLLIIFAVVAAVLAAAGVYGVVSFSVTQRTHEFGIRLALGAAGREILGKVLAGGVRMAAVGLALGLPLAFLATRAIESVLYGVSSLDPATYVGVAMLVVVVSLAACFIPAWRATRVEPSICLRGD